MSRIPVNLVTGFLGSGKTTLIAQLLIQPGFAGTLVVVNEFGEVGIDHDLLEASSDDTILLANGCLCCTIRGNLVDTLLDVQAQVADGRLRVFDRVVVETSGVADPAPLLGFLLSDAAVMALYRLEQVVTTIDAVAGAEALTRHPEADHQARVADRLLLTKTDLASPTAIAALTARLRGLNPVAPILPVIQGRIASEQLLGLGGAQEAAAPCAPGCDDPAHDHAHHHHTDRFSATVLHATRKMEEADIAGIEAALREWAGPQLLRLKGILPLRDGRMAILQAAMMVVHPAEFQPASPHAAGRLVLIAEGAAPMALLTALEAFGLRTATG
jgi:G3E family GTPase